MGEHRLRDWHHPARCTHCDGHPVQEEDGRHGAQEAIVRTSSSVAGMRVCVCFVRVG